MNKISFILFFIFILVNIVYCFENIEIVRSNEASIILKIKPIELSFTDILIKGTRFQKIKSTNELTLLNKEGFPDVPVLVVPLGVPFFSSPQVSIVNAEFEEITDISLIPAPQVFVEETESANYFFEEYQTDKKAYARNRYFPSSLAEFSDFQVIRGQRIAKLQIYPIQYNPVSKIVRKYVSLKIKVSYLSNQIDFSTQSVILKNNAFEHVYKNLLANYSVVKKWKKWQPKRAINVLLQQNDWYNPDYPFYKLQISRDGIYSLSYQDLLNVGIPVDNIYPRTITLNNQGQ